MRRHSAVTRVLALLAATAMLTVLGQCTTKAVTMDADNMTFAQVEGETAEQHYERLRERFQRMHSVFADAQLRISGTAWVWISYGISPTSGASAPRALTLSGDARSYFLDMSATTQSSTLQRGQTPLDVMVEFFVAQGWPYETEERGVAESWWIAHALTGDGDLLTARVQNDGRVTLSLYTGNYWGDASELLRAVSARLPADWERPAQSMPGEFVHLPEW